jgi:hypothetical protein
MLVIKMNLLPWYNELDDYIEVYSPEFPELLRERILAFGEYTIVSISRNETRLQSFEEPRLST